jgi:hypothetical protein
MREQCNLNSAFANEWHNISTVKTIFLLQNAMHVYKLIAGLKIDTFEIITVKTYFSYL